MPDDLSARRPGAVQTTVAATAALLLSIGYRGVARARSHLPAILRICRRAMVPGATLLIVEREMGPPNTAPTSMFRSLNMLVGPAGRERSIEEYAELFGAAGLAYVGVTPSTAGMIVFERVARERS